MSRTVRQSSYAGVAQKAITADNAISASYATTAATVLGSITSASYAATASLLLGSITSASYARTSSYSTTLGASLSNDSNGTLRLGNSAGASISSIIALTASLANNAITSSYVNLLNQNVIITGSLTVTENINARTLVVQTVTSSVEFVTGSTKFGTIYTNTHDFTGSVTIRQSASFGVPLTLNGSLVAASTGNKILEVLGTGGTSIFSPRSNGLVYISSGQLYFEGNYLISKYYDSSISFGTGAVTTASSGANINLYGGIRVYSHDGGTVTPETFKVQGDGKVLVNLTSSEYRFDVAGNARVTGSFNVGSASLDYNQNTSVAIGSYQEIASDVF